MTDVPYTPGPGPTPPGPGYPPGYGYPQPTPAPPRRTGRVILWVVLGVIALCGIGVVGAIAAGGDTARDNQLAAQDDTNRGAAAAGTSAAAAAPSSTGKSTPAQVVVPAGTYTVGEDIPPGRYKSADRAGDLCYWQVSGSGGDLLDNGLGGGFPTFTLKRGQQLETHGCPDFVLQAK